MPNYLNTFSGIGGLMPQQQGQANQPVMPQAASQLGASVGLQPAGNPGGLSVAAGLNAPQQPAWNAVPQKTPVLGMPAMADGGMVPARSKDSVVKEAQMAVSGAHPNPREAIAKFEGIMGTDATNDLIRDFAKGGRIRGSGGGVDDLVPGSIDGREDVRLASGEYVIPARVVSALGDGDTDRGAEILDAFCERVRATAAQHMSGSDPMDVKALLPEMN